MTGIGLYRHQIFKYSETFILSQMKAMKRYEPHLLGLELSGNIDNTIPYFCAQYDGFYKKLKHRIFNPIDLLYQYCLAHKIKLIHAHFGIDGIYAKKLAEKLQVPLVITFHGIDASISSLGLLKSRKISFYQYLLKRGQLRQADLVICVSDAIKQKLISQGFPEKKLVTHYIGVNTSLFKPKRNSIKVPEFRILQIGRLVEKKGAIYLINAFSELRKKHNHLKLDIVGDGPLKAKLRKVVDNLGLSSDVRFHYSVPHMEVLRLIGLSDVLCLPSVTSKNGDSEGLVTALLEASSCALPVVAFKNGGMVEAINDGETGFLLEERDVAGLVDRLTCLIENESLGQTMGARARRHMVQHFDLYRQTEKLERLYYDVLGK